MECGISNNPQLAMKFLEDAQALAPKDPSVRHEMGVIKFNERRYAFALTHIVILSRAGYSFLFRLKKFY